MICTNCNNEMTFFQKYGSCGWRCPNCSDELVTTYIDPVYEDETDYTLSIHPVEDPTSAMIKVVSKIMNCNFLNAKRKISSGEATIQGKAITILKVIAELQENAISYSITPEFNQTNAE